jgi:hypothetical protein
MNYGYENSKYLHYNEKNLDLLEKEYPLNSNISYGKENNLISYIDGDSTSINNALMAETKGEYYSQREYKIGEDIDKTIENKGHSLKQNTTLWRGEDDLYIKNPKVSEAHSWDRLTSTSFDKNVGERFQQQGWLYEIQAPKGTKGLYLEDLTNQLEKMNICWEYEQNLKY